MSVLPIDNKILAAFKADEDTAYVIRGGTDVTSIQVINGEQSGDLPGGSALARVIRSLYYPRPGHPYNPPYTGDKRMAENLASVMSSKPGQRITVISTKGRSMRLTIMESDMYRLVIDLPMFSVADVASMQGLKDRAARNYVGRLRNLGLVKINDLGVYEVVR